MTADLAAITERLGEALGELDAALKAVRDRFDDALKATDEAFAALGDLQPLVSVHEWGDE